MEFIFLMMVFGGIGLAAYGLIFAKKTSNAVKAGSQRPRLGAGDPLADPTVGGDAEFWALKPGDLLKHIDGTDYLVRRSVFLNEGNYRWNEHLLDDAAGNRKWLSVEDDQGLDLGLWDPVPQGALESGEPGARVVTVQGMQFTLQEQGSANYSYTSPTGEWQEGGTNYVQYEAPTGKMLAFQSYDGSGWEISMGDRASSADFDIYPSQDDQTTEKGI